MKPNVLKGTVMIASGVIVAFFPSIISSLFYIIGMALIICCVINIIRSLTAGSSGGILSNVIGIIIGSAITSLPHFVQLVIPLTIGIILAVNGLDFAAKFFGNVGSRILNLILAVINLGLGCTLLFNLVNAGNATRMIAGLVMIGAGVYDFFTNRNSSSGNGNIIDI